MKASNPIELAQYVAGNRLDVEPDFKWWVRDMLRVRNIITAKLKAKYWRTTHKFGIQVPKSIDKSLAIDKENGNTIWYTAIQKEMKNVRVDFEAWEEGSLEDPQAWPKVSGISRNPLPYDILYQDGRMIYT